MDVLTLECYSTRVLVPPLVVDLSRNNEAFCRDELGLSSLECLSCLWAEQQLLKRVFKNLITLLNGEKEGHFEK